MKYLAGLRREILFFPKIQPNTQEKETNMNHPRSWRALILFGGGCLAALFLIVTVNVVIENVGAGPRDPKVCKDQPAHLYAADPGKLNPDNLGPPVQNPTDIEAVHQQFNQAHCDGVQNIAVSAWYLRIPSAPQDADGINLLAGMLTGSGEARQAWGDSIIDSVWSDQAKPHIGYWTGNYWTMAAHEVDGHWMVYQTQVHMENKPVLEITFPDGTTGQWKMECWWQPVNKVGPFPGIPTSPPTVFVPPPTAPPDTVTTPGPTTPTPTGGPSTTPPPHRTTTTRPPIVTTTTKPGKIAEQHPISNPAVPAPVKGCGPSGCGGVTTKPANPDIDPGKPNPSTGCNPTCDGGSPPTTRKTPPSSAPVPATTAPPGPSPKPK